jgi:hypothetical protein
MKVTCLSVLLLATSAEAYRNGPRGNQGKRRGLKTGENVLNMNKVAKGMKGMGKKDEKAKKDKGMKEEKAGMTEKASCQSVKIKANYTEIEAGLDETALGETLSFPVYDYYTDEPIGTYTDSTTQIFVGGAYVDCTFAGSFNFDFDASLEYPFVSQVTVSGTCLGASNSITGGTGQYSCASGSEIFLDPDADYFASDLVICNTCA